MKKASIARASYSVCKISKHTSTMERQISSATPTLIAPLICHLRLTFKTYSYLDGIGRRRTAFEMRLQPGKRNIKSWDFPATCIATATLHPFFDADKPAPHFPPLLHAFHHLQINVVCNLFPGVVCNSNIFVILHQRIVQMFVFSDLFSKTFFDPVHGNVKTRDKYIGDLHLEELC